MRFHKIILTSPFGGGTRGEGIIVIVSLFALAFLSGCGPKPLPTKPVHGMVMFNGKPLDHGAVVLQPDVGPLAKGRIQSDGSFRLSSYKPNDGAVIGRHQVQIVCREEFPKSKTSAGGEVSFGRSLIPEKYADFLTSGMTVEIKPSGDDPLLLDLTGSAPK